MTGVGIALSGGGITGIVAGMCSMNSLITHLGLESLANVTVSTVSGGTIAYGVHANALEQGIGLSYPLYDPSTPPSSIPLEITTDENPLWFANVINYLAWIPLPDTLASSSSDTPPLQGQQEQQAQRTEDSACCAGACPSGTSKYYMLEVLGDGDAMCSETCLSPSSYAVQQHLSPRLALAPVDDACRSLGYPNYSVTTTRGVGPLSATRDIYDHARRLWSPSFQANWWTDAIDVLFWEGYGIHDYDIDGGDGEGSWYANFAVLDETVCPIELDEDYTYAAAGRHLSYGSMEMRSGSLFVTPSSGLSIEHKTPLDIMSYSSAFWAASILEGSGGFIDPSYLLLKGSVATATLSPGQTAYLADGGLVDTTGIATLLRQKVSRIVAFYDNNDPLAKLNAPIAHLFGVAGPSNEMNNLPGPQLSQVFEENLFEGLYRNLTDPALLRGRLTGVAVRGNTYFGIEAYELDELLIFSTEYSEVFLSSFNDPEGIKGAVDLELWPNAFPVSMQPEDANLLCMLCDWRTIVHIDEVKNLFSAEPRTA